MCAICSPQTVLWQVPDFPNNQPAHSGSPSIFKHRSIQWKQKQLFTGKVGSLIELNSSPNWPLASYQGTHQIVPVVISLLQYHQQVMPPSLARCARAARICAWASICMHAWRGESSCKCKWELPWGLITRMRKYIYTSRTRAKQWMFYNTVFHMQQKIPRANQEARARVILRRQVSLSKRYREDLHGEGFVLIHWWSLFRLAISTVNVHNTLYTCSVCLCYC